ncbi:hemagglutinin [Brenneria rubrifaciens]|uniref:Hemagglutinin n=1 Tax=Brenneria rubrifaciens TaxID=55213 RepID=A0A4P8QUU3_9GAMM|nr:hemagglutinin [Brenneria rubrifaciens]
MFNRQSLSDRQIRNYAQSLTGGKAFKETAPGKVWTAELADGSTVNLRNISQSADQTKARRTLLVMSH